MAGAEHPAPSAVALVALQIDAACATERGAGRAGASGDAAGAHLPGRAADLAAAALVRGAEDCAAGVHALAADTANAHRADIPASAAVGGVAL